MPHVKISDELIRKVAKLAHLKLSDQEVSQYSSQLDKIVEYVEQVSSADTTGVEPLYLPNQMGTPLRDDVPEPFKTGDSGHSDVIESAQETLHGCFKVPQVL